MRCIRRLEQAIWNKKEIYDELVDINDTIEDIVEQIDEQVEVIQDILDKEDNELAIKLKKEISKLENLASWL